MLLLRALLLACFFINRLVGEEVEVVEAVSGSAPEHRTAPETDEPSAAKQTAQNRDDTEAASSDQVAQESTPDQVQQESAPKINYGPPPPLPNRGHPLSLPVRGHPPPHHGPPGKLYHQSHIKVHPEHPPLHGYHGPPPPPPPIAPPQKSHPPALPPSPEVLDKLYNGGEPWPISTSDMPKIVSLDVKCEKNLMKVFIGFDKPFFGIVFSKGHYSNVNCVHLPAGLGRSSASFEISIHACGTAGNTENGLYGYGADSGSGTYFENIIVIQYDPQVQEVWDQARKLRCTWHDQYEKSVTFRPFPVDMLDVVRADFAGDNVGCWMQIQVGKGPWASEVSGLVKIGQTMTMVLAIKDDDSKFDMLVRNCMAHDGKRAPIQLVDQRGCVTRSKLMSRFTKIKNFGASASVLSYAHFQAFKFPDSMEVHFQCTIQICRYQCPDQCSDANAILHAQHSNLLEAHHPAIGHESAYGPPPAQSLPIDVYLHGGSRPRDERRVRRQRREVGPDEEADVGVNRIIRVVSTGDLTFSLDDSTNSSIPPMVFPAKPDDSSGMICMTTLGFSATLCVLLAILFVTCIMSAFLYTRLRPFSKSKKHLTSTYSSHNVPKKSRGCFFS